ncbi:MAG: peptidase, partial [Pusillimonas sp.]
MWRVLAGVLLALWVGSAVGADTPQALAARQAEAKKQQAELRSRIDALQKQIDHQESSRRDAASDLKDSESAISDIDRRLNELERQKERVSDELERLSSQTASQKKLMGQRQAELARQLRARYSSGLSPWAALLSGDDPQAISRELSYLGYISRAQAGA